ncbi:MAG: cytochrome c biogenesis protein CcdA [Euryarchaeota archaeon]|nr:cytochrome c biogenesis protein CcdA [Euryarchaeota archaeon]
MLAEPSLALVFLAGVLTVATPCIIPILPPLLAGSVGSRLRPVAIVLGMSITFTLMGGLFSALGIAASAAGEVMRYVAIGFLILFGVVMVDDGLNSAYTRLSSAVVGKVSGFLPGGGGESIGSAFLLGLSLGIVWIPCVGPVLGAVLSYVAMGGDVVRGSLMLFVYSLGLGVPMLAVAYGSKRYAVVQEEFEADKARRRVGDNTDRHRDTAGCGQVSAGKAAALLPGAALGGECFGKEEKEAQKGAEEERARWQPPRLCAGSGGAAGSHGPLCAEVQVRGGGRHPGGHT